MLHSRPLAFYGILVSALKLGHGFLLQILGSLI